MQLQQGRASWGPLMSRVATERPVVEEFRDRSHSPELFSDLKFRDPEHLGYGTRSGRVEL